MATGRAVRHDTLVVQDGEQEADAREIETIPDNWIAEWSAISHTGERDVAGAAMFLPVTLGNYSQSRADISAAGKPVAFLFFLLLFFLRKIALPFFVRLTFHR